MVTALGAAKRWRAALATLAAELGEAAELTDVALQGAVWLGERWMCLP